MSDDDLRSLERAAREAPQDRARRLRYAQALERSGARRPAFLEFAGLAREGESEARERVTSWTPRSGLDGPSGASRSSRKALRRAPRVVRRGEVEVEPTLHGSSTVMLPAATDTHLVLTNRSTLAGVSLDDLSVKWAIKRAGTSSDWCAVGGTGDEIVYAGYDEELVLCDPATGCVLARAPVLGSAASVLTSGDRALIPFSTYAADGPNVIAVDLGSDFGRVLWGQTIDDAQGALIIGDVVLFPFDDAPSLQQQMSIVHSGIEARRLEDGRALWRHPLNSPGGPSRAHRMECGDARGLILSESPRPSPLLGVEKLRARPLASTSLVSMRSRADGRSTALRSTRSRSRTTPCSPPGPRILIADPRGPGTTSYSRLAGRRGPSGGASPLAIPPGSRSRSMTWSTSGRSTSTSWRPR